MRNHETDLPGLLHGLHGRGNCAACAETCGTPGLVKERSGGVEGQTDPRTIGLELAGAIKQLLVRFELKLAINVLEEVLAHPEVLDGQEELRGLFSKFAVDFEAPGPATPPATPNGPASPGKGSSASRQGGFFSAVTLPGGSTSSVSSSAGGRGGGLGRVLSFSSNPDYVPANSTMPVLRESEGSFNEGPEVVSNTSEGSKGSNSKAARLGQPDKWPEESVKQNHVLFDMVASETVMKSMQRFRSMQDHRRAITSSNDVPILNALARRATVGVGSLANVSESSSPNFPERGSSSSPMPGNHPFALLAHHRGETKPIWKMLRTAHTMDLLDEVMLSVPTNSFLIHPSGFVRLSWDLCALLFILEEAVTVPLTVFFQMAVPTFIVWVVTLFFAVDIVLNFITGYFHDGVLVMRSSFILRHYLFGWFMLDLLATIPWQVVDVTISAEGTSVAKLAKLSKTVRVLRLIRVWKLNELADKMESLLNGAFQALSIQLVKIIVCLALLVHWAACMWGWIGHPGGDANSGDAECDPGGACEPGIIGSPWRRRYAVESQSLSEQYMIALRFATAIFVGGDSEIQPGNAGERMFVTLLSFLAFIVCSIFISQIMVMFHKLNEQHSEQQEIMRNFREFMSAGKLPVQLRAKVKRFLEFQFKSRKEVRIRRFELLERLSPGLRKELQAHMNLNVLIQHRFFRDMPKAVLAHACCMAAVVDCAPGDSITVPGQSTAKMFFLVRGKLHVSLREGGDTLDSFDMVKGEENDDAEESSGLLNFFVTPPFCFGAHNLIRPQAQDYTITSVAHSELLAISRSNIQTLLEEFPSLEAYLRTFQDSAQKRSNTIGTQHEPEPTSKATQALRRVSHAVWRPHAALNSITPAPEFK